MLHKFATLKTPLQPDGASLAETKGDLWTEFGNLLDESRKSLKRSLLLVGGIVRGYMRRGQKKDEWVKIVRRLESRIENSDRPLHASDMISPHPTITPSIHSDYPVRTASSITITLEFGSHFLFLLVRSTTLFGRPFQIFTSTATISLCETPCVSNFTRCTRIILLNLNSTYHS